VEGKVMIFVTGGVRSGKSSFAEQLAVEIASEHQLHLHYIATSEETDDEMRKRITLHRLAREKSPLPWKTWEFPYPNLHLISNFGKEDVILLDCLTTWMGNVCFHQFECSPPSTSEAFMNSTVLKVMNTIDAFSARVHTFILVSNELLHDGNLDDPYVFAYQRMIGLLHQKIVNRADTAFLVETGIALKMKG
jgi:adenosylcobinamide kinase / adenosylcobinamide-phosphate guanylyltransferase